MEPPTATRPAAPAPAAWIIGAGVLAALLVIAGCQSTDGPPRSIAPRAPVTAGVPQPEPRSRIGNHSPYEVFGRTYRVLPSADGFVEEGLASWYGRKFHGRTTSNGERFDMNRISAAHKHLPLPTWVRVTNLENGRTLDVRVNDRGPFHGERVIDLSHAAARALGYADQGIARVRVEAIDFGTAVAQPPRPPVSAPGTTPPQRLAETTPTVTTPVTDAAGIGASSAAAAEPATASSATAALPSATAAPELIWLQAGAFRDRDSARQLAAAIDDLVGHEAKVEMIAQADDLVRVRLGPFADAFAAERLQAVLMTADVARPLLIREAALAPPAEGGCGPAAATC